MTEYTKVKHKFVSQEEHEKNLEAVADLSKDLQAFGTFLKEKYGSTVYFCGVITDDNRCLMSRYGSQKTIITLLNGLLETEIIESQDIKS